MHIISVVVVVASGGRAVAPRSACTYGGQIRNEVHELSINDPLLSMHCSATKKNTQVLILSGYIQRYTNNITNVFNCKKNNGVMTNFDD